MSIEKELNSFILTCDNCGEELSESFDDFYEAVDAKKEYNWKSKKINGNWEDWCEECCK